VVLWAVISLPNSCVKGARFWGFPCSRVRGAFGGISSISLVWTSFGGIKLGYGLLMCCSSRAAQATPVCPVLLTDLTGATLGGFLLG
jgi:hypothetical protein